MAEFKVNTQTLATVATVLIVAVIGLGLFGRVSALEQRAATLEVEFRELERFRDALETIELKIATVRTDMDELQNARDDILRAICDLLGRQPQQCGLVPDAPDIPPVPPDSVP